jgi:sugar/nucleoside kinase (ribokinase family)
VQAVVAGHICLDIIPLINSEGSELFLAHLQPGRLVEIGAAAFSTGGLVSNTGVTLHKLGVPTWLMGKVGADLLGQVVRHIVGSLSPALSDGMIVDAASSTSYTIILNPPGVDRVLLHCPGANETFCADDIDHHRVAQADLFHFGYPPLMRRMYEQGGVELARIMRRAKLAGALTSLDMALPDPGSPAGRADWLQIFKTTLPFVDIFLPSIEELLFCLRRPLYEQLTSRGGSFLDQVTPELLSEISDELLKMGTKVVLIKLGERGLYLRTAEVEELQAVGHGVDWKRWGWQELWAPCFQVEVVGTTGSGDATIAGFLSGLLRGLPPVEVMTMAVAVGACNVEAADALSGIRSWEATAARVRSGWPRQTLSLSAAGWHWHPEHQVGVGPGSQRV